jgi:hypothetical protein
MKEYDLEQDTPFGIASADFPVTFYDRPGLMFSNLLRGDVDGLTRAMLSPDTMSPSQMKTVQDFFLKGKKPNPIIKTILDVTTNPLVIAGLAVGLWKFPVGTTSSLLNLRRGLLPKAAAMGNMASHLHDAMMNLRYIPGMFEKLLGVTEETTKFASKHWQKLDDIFTRAGPLSKTEGLIVSARLDGLHKAEHYAVKFLRNEPEWQALMGAKDVPIAAGIQNKMSPRLIKLSDELRNWFTNVRGNLTKNPEMLNRVKKAVEAKGLNFGDFVDDYFPHQGVYNKYYKTKLRGTTGVNYRKWLHKEAAEKVGREEIQRLGGMIPNLDELKELEKAGVIKSGFTDMAKTVLDRKTKEISDFVRKNWNDIKSLGLDEGRERLEFVRRMEKTSFAKHFGSPGKIRDNLDEMAGALQEAAFKGPEAVKAEMFEIGKTIASPTSYSLNPWEATGGYLNSTASTYAWHGTGHGAWIMSKMREPNIFKDAPYLETYLKDDLIPHVRGLKSYKEMMRSLNYSVRKEKIFNWLNTHPMIDKIVGTDRKKWLLDYFGKSKALSSSEALGATVSHHFYLTALGANLSSASKNMLQSFVTTINTPGVGVKGMWYGLKGVAGQEGLLSKMQKYLGYMSKGIGHEEAFNTAFPEFVKDAGNASKIVDAMLAGDVAREGYARIVQKTGVEKIKKVLMAPFASSEAGNRLLAYYAGRNSHIAQNASKLVGATEAAKTALFTEAGEVGQTLNMFANFTGGPLGLPRALINMAPQYRQFMHFPLRFMGYLHGSLRLGADPNKLDWGTIGRAMAGSTTAYFAARNLLGADISGGLLTGALPLPQYEKSPFYPWPLVPPVAQIAGASVKSLMTGDMSGMGDVAGLLLPGGIAARRAYKSLSPKFADYENPTAEGRVPLYNKDGSLIGTMTPMELTLRAVGLRPMSASAESGAAKWLVSQRDRIRTYRRDYTMALFQNDTAKAEKINREFQKVYPELGKIQIKKSDITALENRRQISRLQRISKGISSSYRPLFEQVIGEASLGKMTEDIQMNGLGALENYQNIF